MLFKVKHKITSRIYTVYSVDHWPYDENHNSLTKTYFLIFSGTSWRWESSENYIPLEAE